MAAADLLSEWLAFLPISSARPKRLSSRQELVQKNEFILNNLDHATDALS
jgi:hypothetical protein